MDRAQLPAAQFAQFQPSASPGDIDFIAEVWYNTN